MNAVEDVNERSDFLTRIMVRRRERFALTRRALDIEQLRETAFLARTKGASHRLRHALKRDRGINIIAEFKRASPSKGLISEGADAARVAADYAAGGACAMSVLTEEDFFRGSLDDLRAVRNEVALPVLRKDFIFDEVQILEAAEAGADAVLLIVRAIEDEELAALLRFTEEDLGMDALVEVHTKEEMRRAAAAGATLIGVNNRNLDTFDVSLETSIELAAIAPRGAVLVSESGLRDAEDLRRLRSHGYHGFLIGESLMRADDPRRALAELIAACEL